MCATIPLARGTSFKRTGLDVARRGQGDVVHVLQSADERGAAVLREQVTLVDVVGIGGDLGVARNDE